MEKNTVNPTNLYLVIYHYLVRSYCRLHVGILLFIFGLSFLCSCNDQIATNDMPYVPQQIEKSIHLTLPENRMMMNSDGQITDSKENQIDNLDFLFFDANNKIINHAVFLNSSDLTTKQGLVSTPNVSFPVGAKSVVAFANVHDLIVSVLKDENWSSPETYDDLKKRLVFSQSGKWDSSHLMPMWARTTDLDVQEGMDAVTMSLIQIFAKVNVSFMTSVKDFKLTGVYLCNSLGGGAVIPDQDDQQQPVLSIPSTVSVNDPILYENGDIDVQNNKCTDKIYCFEGYADPTKTEKPVFLVLRGTQNGKVAYFRINFLNQDKTDNPHVTKYFDLHRHHYYSVTIERMEAGYSSLDEAMKSKGGNADYSINVMDGNDMHYVVANENNQLGLSCINVNLWNYVYSASNSTTDNQIMIKTDFKEGWTSKILPNSDGKVPDWFSLSKTSSTDVNKTDTVYVFVPNPHPGEEGTIRITAGPLYMDITVKQSANKETSLTLERKTAEGNYVPVKGDLLHFSDSNPEEMSFRLKWFPTSEIPKITHDIYNEPFRFYKGKNSDCALLDTMSQVPDHLDKPGEYDFKVTTKILSDPNRTVIDKTTRINFKIGNNLCNVNFVQEKKGIELVGFYPNQEVGLPERMPRFYVLSNVPWKVANLRQPNPSIVYDDKALSSLKGGNYFLSREPVRWAYKLETVDGKAISFDIVPQNPQDDVAKVSVNAIAKIYPNSYIVAPNSSITIPVEKAYMIWDQDMNVTLDGNNVEAGLLWQDHIGLVNPNDIQMTGLGRDAKITVNVHGGQKNSDDPDDYQSSDGGNAVIYIRDRSTQTIRWCWHLWITNYDPESDVQTNKIIMHDGLRMMDRGLGALRNAQDGSNASTYGLLFQFGRNVPFVGPGNQTNTLRQVYDKNGSPKSFDVKTFNNSPLYEAIENPMSALIIEGTKDWTTEDISQFWRTPRVKGPNQKGFFDPCPARWHVPRVGDWQTTHSMIGDMSKTTFHHINSSNYYTWDAPGDVPEGDVYYGPSKDYYPEEGFLNIVGNSLVPTDFRQIVYMWAIDGHEYDDSKNSILAADLPSSQKWQFYNVRCIRDWVPEGH